MDVRGLRITLSLCASIVLGLAAAAPAQAAFGVTVNKAAPGSKNAGANSQFDLDISFSGGEDVRDLTVHLPPGLVGDPTSAPLCSEVQLEADTCPAQSQIGTTITTATVLLPSDTTINGSVYNVQPRSGEPARLGIVLRPDTGGTVVLQSPAKLRSSDFGLDTVLEDIPNTAVVLGLTVPITIARIQLSLEGDFMRNPTSCGEKTTTADAISYSETAASGSNSFTSVNCAALPFSPEFTAKVGSPGHTTAFTKPPQTTVISQDDGEAGLRVANVLLPPGVGGDNDQLGNTCSVSNFQAHSCPALAIVGQATAESPLQEQALEGPMALVANPEGGLPLLGLDLEGALALQLYGNLSILPSSEGTETRVVFNGLPDIPIARFELELLEDRLNLLARDICEPPDLFYNTTFTSHGDVVDTGTTQGTVEGCAPSVVDPTAKARIRNFSSNNPRLKVIVRKGSASLNDIVVKAPREASFKNKGAIVVTAEGQEIDTGAVKRSKRKLTIEVPDVDDVKVKASKGALRLKDSVKKGDELAFSVDATDSDSNHFSLPTPAVAR